MAKPTLETFAEVASTVSAVRRLEMWERAKIKGATSKEKIFTAGVEAGVKMMIHSAFGVTRMPTEPTEEILAAMQQAGARQDWAADIYRAIAQIINKEKVK